MIFDWNVSQLLTNFSAKDVAFFYVAEKSDTKA